MTQGLLQLAGKVFTQQIVQGALSGGGYNGILAMANDGSLLMNYDGCNLWKWNNSTAQFDNAYSQFKLPAAYQSWGQNTTNAFGYGCQEIAFATNDSTRAISIAGSGNQEGLLWLSDNSQATWSEVGTTGTHFPFSFHNLRGTGPCMAVDPNNKNHVIWSDAAGIIYETLDNFTTITKSNPGGLPTAIVTTTTTGSPMAFSGADVSSLVQTRNNYAVNCSDFTANPQTFNNCGILGIAEVTSATSTSVSFSGGMGTGTRGFIPKVFSGDTIVFGYYACIAFCPDTSAGNKTTRGAVTVTKNVYIGWGYGATQVFRSTDGGANYSGIGGPSQVLAITCSTDNTLYVCDNVGSYQNNLQNLSLPPFNNVNDQILGIAAGTAGVIRLTVNNTFNWTSRKVNVTGVTGTGSTSTNGFWTIGNITATTVDLVGSTFTGSPSGGLIQLPVFNAWKFASSTWTQLAPDNLSALDGGWVTCAADSSNNGHIALASVTGGIQYATDAGAAGSSSWYAGSGGPFHTDQTAAGNVPWLEYPARAGPPPFGFQGGSAAGRISWDLSNPGRLYMSTGVGLFYATPATYVGQTQPSINWTQQNRYQAGLIVRDIVKVPGGGILTAQEDQHGSYAPDFTHDPNYMIEQLFGNGSGVEYAKDNNAYLYLVANSHLYVSTNSGADGFIDKGQVLTPGGFSTALACQAKDNLVSSSDGNYPGGGTSYTLNATTSNTWANSLFNGALWESSRLAVTGHTLIPDPTNINNFWAYVTGFGSACASVFAAVIAGGGAGLRYSVDDVLNIAGGNGSPATVGRVRVKTVGAGGAVSSIAIEDAGMWFNVAPPSPNSPTPNVNASITNFTNNGGLVRLTVDSAGALQTGDSRTVSGVTQTGGPTTVNGTWTITVVNSTTIDLQGSTFVGGSVYTGGGSLPRGVGLSITFTTTNPCGAWLSTDKGANFTQQNTVFPTACPGGGTDVQFSAVPGNSGHLFIAGGNVSASGIPLARSTDGGVTWSAVSNTQVAWQVHVGATKSGATYPSIYFLGLANGDGATTPGPGFYQSNDNCVTWIRLCGAPGGNMDISTKIFADQSVYGTFVISTGNTGYIAGFLQ